MTIKVFEEVPPLILKKIITWIYTMKKTTISTFKKDKYYDSIKTAVASLLKLSNVITPIDVFIQIGNLTKENYEKWRFKKIPYLERVIECNLSAINRKLRILKYHAVEVGLKPSKTVYKSWGKTEKIFLRFSKTGNELIEDIFSTHYIHPDIKNNS